jgi:hypothetical protein
LEFGCRPLSVLQKTSRNIITAIRKTRAEKVIKNHRGGEKSYSKSYKNKSNKNNKSNKTTEGSCKKKNNGSRG